MTINRKNPMVNRISKIKNHACNGGGEEILCADDICISEIFFISVRIFFIYIFLTV